MSNKSRATVLSQKGSIGIQERRSSSDIDDSEAQERCQIYLFSKRSRNKKTMKKVGMETSSQVSFFQGLQRKV